MYCKECKAIMHSLAKLYTRSEYENLQQTNQKVNSELEELIGAK
jgi:hypothetical protein